MGLASSGNGRRRWLPRGVKGWTAVALVVVLLGVGVPILVRNLGDNGERAAVALMAPRYRADPLAAPELLDKSDLAGNCGVSRATRDELVPQADLMNHCEWYSLTGVDGGDRNCAFCPARSGDVVRHLRVSLGFNSDESDDDISSIGAAMRNIQHLRSQAAGGTVPFSRVTGLGDEGIARYVPVSNRGATVVFRYRNATVSVGYYGDTTAGKDRHRVLLPKRRALEGALRVAAEVAASLGTQASPKLAGQPSGEAALRDVPKPCDTVPKAVLDTVSHDADRSGRTTYHGPMAPFVDTVTDRTCVWTGSTTDPNSDDAIDDRTEQALSVSLATFADNDRTGPGSRTAAHIYRANHYNARHAGHHFHVLAGIGEQAYEEYVPSSGGKDVPSARVVSRAHNVLITVEYFATRERFDEPIDRAKALASAYTVASDVARAMPA